MKKYQVLFHTGIHVNAYNKIVVIEFLREQKKDMTDESDVQGNNI